MRSPVLTRIREEILVPEVETILHPSPLRLKWLGFFTLIGHPSFWWVWSVLIPQPFESLWARLFLASTGLGLFLQQTKDASPGVFTRRYFSLVCWLQLPVFFTWMYWMNHGSTVWLATIAAMIVIYYHLTDWRLASLGLVTGALLGTALAYAQLGGALASVPPANLVVVAFAWFSAISLAASSANLRRVRLRHSLAVIGIMAHELRTPLATMSLIGQAMRVEAHTREHSETEKEDRLDKMADRIEALTRMINHHIDLQMINARFMQLPRASELISAPDLVNQVVAAYPYSSQREQRCIEVLVHQDFCFFGSNRQFTQVLNNLIKNALYSLKAAQSRFNAGDLRIELGVKSKIGKISVSDQGIGINADHLKRIFEPFFSTSNDTGHGLGLAYSRQVVHNAGGFIRVKSEPAFGAIFSIELPVQDCNPPATDSHAIAPLPPT